MAHKMGAGSTKNTRDSNPKRLGVKRYGAEIVKSGNSVKNRVISELKVKTKNLPNHIYNW